MACSVQHRLRRRKIRLAYTHMNNRTAGLLQLGGHLDQFHYMERRYLGQSGCERKLHDSLSLTTSGDFSRAQCGGQLVEHTVDVLVTVNAAKGFGQLDGFIDDDLVWNLYQVLEFESTNQ